MKILFLLFISFSFSQSLVESIIDTYNNGMPKTVKYYKSISNNIELSILKTYYKNGQVLSEVRYKDGKKNGKSISYYDNSQIKDQGYYKDGLMNGRWIFYYSNGQIMSIGSFKDSKGLELNSSGIPIDNRTGGWISYYRDGSLLQKTSYKSGKKNGIEIVYYQSGQKKELMKYSKNKLNGKKTEYYESGKVYSEVNYEKNNKEGLFVTYYESGIKKEQKNYYKDKLNGEFIEYYKNGQIKSEGSYKNGKKYGMFIIYYEDGGIKEVIDSSISSKPSSSSLNTKVVISNKQSNSAPIFISSPNLDANVDRKYRYRIILEDKDSDKIDVEVLSKPNWMSFNNRRLVLDGTPGNNDVGEYQIKISATDNINSKIYQEFIVTVKGKSMLANNKSVSSPSLSNIIIDWEPIKFLDFSALKSNLKFMSLEEVKIKIDNMIANDDDDIIKKNFNFDASIKATCYIVNPDDIKLVNNRYVGQKCLIIKFKNEKIEIDYKKDFKIKDYKGDYIFVVK